MIIILDWASPAQTHNDRELARMLSDENTRESAVSSIVSAGAAKVPLLLSWARTPPPDVDVTYLFVGMADAFGALKSKEAIPFLIKHISIQRGWIPAVDTWMKTPAVVEDRLPAVKALIRIGPDAARALLKVPWDGMSSEDRLSALFVVAHVGDGSDSREYIGRALGEANLQHFWAEQGLRVLDERKPPSK
jgi:hypothetical protein